MPDPITVRVVGLPEVQEEADGVEGSKKVALAYAKLHPDRWVEAVRPTHEVVHAIAPTACVGGESLDTDQDEIPVLEGQEGIF